MKEIETDGAGNGWPLNHLVGFEHVQDQVEDLLCETKQAVYSRYSGLCLSTMSADCNKKERGD